MRNLKAEIKMRDNIIASQKLDVLTAEAIKDEYQSKYEKLKMLILGDNTSKLDIIVGLKMIEEGKL